MDFEWGGMNSRLSIGCREQFSLAFVAEERPTFEGCRNEWVYLAQ